MRGFRSSVVLVPLALVAVACSDGDAAPGTTQPSAAVAVAPTAPSTTAQPTTTVPTTTTQPTTTMPTTTAPSTTAPPTVAPGSVEEQVIAAALDSWRLLNEAYQDPTNDEKVRAAGQAHIGSLRDAVIEAIAEFRLNNWRAIPNPDVAASLTPYPGEVTVDVNAGTASVTYCEVNPWILVETAGSPDGSDRVVDDDVSAQRVRADMLFVEGRWLPANGEQLMNWSDEATCPDLP